MNRVRGVWGIQMKGIRGALFSPWLIVAAIFILNFIGLQVAGTSTGVDEGYNGAIVTLYIYAFVYSIVMVNQTYPYAIGMSVRRADYFNGSLLFLVFTGAVSAVITVMLSTVEQWTSRWGGTIQFFTLPYINEGGVLRQFIVIFILMMVFNLSGFFFGSLHRCFKGKGVWMFFGGCAVVIGLLIYIPGGRESLLNIANWIGNHDAFTMGLISIPLAGVLALVSWALLQKAEV
ncbi:hypothetical protein KIH86_22450 [Paenibacillus sp. HN-1]|uniref:hypothetical protein n=1 Tax=Paenibacillus TaxID=44249 RepID=UPI001CA92E12|nr:MULTISPECIES: hypothetical protein [Paenibacillus]MBY9079232.1 hypothetical protein [Paenibacillus sp. CGMCC 1.18879]MBY9086955.1 hypothetical protein [Paenibacillus sinensis]